MASEARPNYILCNDHVPQQLIPGHFLVSSCSQCYLQSQAAQAYSSYFVWNFGSEPFIRLCMGIYQIFQNSVYLKVRLSLRLVRSLRTIRGRFRRFPVGVVPPLERNGRPVCSLHSPNCSQRTNFTKCSLVTMGSNESP